MRSAALTTVALVAFAANSVLCRVALRGLTIDAATFSTIRLTSGAAALLLIVASTQKNTFSLNGSWTSAALLFLYAIPFSFAYAKLSTGTGALILFGSVQMTMMSAAIRAGERPNAMQWTGVILAISGLVYLVLPGLSAPPFSGAALMALAGVSWGLYSLRGRGAANALAQTTGNFVRSIPFVLAVNLFAWRQLHVEPNGALLAAASGALTSGLGYVVWYAALRFLTATRAAVVQLSVPVLAAGGGVVFLSESLSARLILSTMLVLGGIALALLGRKPGATTAAVAAGNV